MTFTKDSETNAFIQTSKPNYTWPETNGLIHFFAFSPSTSVMHERHGISDSGFELQNRSTFKNGSAAIDYRMTRFYVPSDISRQFDFITAYVSAQKTENAIDLNFKHQLSSIEVKAWGNSERYNFEIAGICLGNPEIEGTFNFMPSAQEGPAAAGSWSAPTGNSKGSVRYIFGSNDQVVSIKSNTGATAANAISIMGKGGPAMVIPTINTAWEAKADPAIGNIPYATGKMYFSVLLRVESAKDGKRMYPYSDDIHHPYMRVIYFALDKSGKILSRVYPGDTAGTYFSDETATIPFAIPTGAVVKSYGWAAVPLDVNWKAGMKYVYTLDYSKGIGLHDPDDPEPGTPIIEKTSISWGVSIDDWKYDEDFDPELEAPWK